MTIGSAEDPAEIRSYKLRTGRLGPVAKAAMERQWPLIGFDVPRNERRAPMPPLDLNELFGTDAPVILEIGFGMGDATAELASRDPAVSVLACDVHMPGIAVLTKYVEDRGLRNLRIANGDAIDLLRDHLQPGSLSGVRVFFPDPWPKHRHRKRRLVSSDFLDLLATRLRSGSVLHFATDWDSYAEQVRTTIAAHGEFELIDEIPWRPVTKFERTGIEAGRSSTDLAARRR